MTDLSHIATLARAFEVLTPGPGRAAEEGRRLDALLVLEALAEASARLDGGRLHLRIMDWLCDWIRAESPVGGAVRWPLARPEEPIDDADQIERRFRFESHLARLCHVEDTPRWPSNLCEWMATLPAPRADVQLALTVLGRRSEAQRAVEWLGDAPARDWGGQLRERPSRDSWDSWPPNRAAGLPAGRWGGRWVPDLSWTNLQRYRLDGAHLAGARLRGTALQGASLQSADLAQATLFGARLDAADLGNVDLRGALLDGASAQCAAFVQADLRRASMIEMVLCEADLRDARIAEASFDRSILDGASLTEIPKGEIDQTDLTRAQIAAARPVRPAPRVVAGPDRHWPRPVPPVGA